MIAVEMVPIADLKADPENPRRADPDRLDMVELSLSRLGWLLPVYIAADGEILSGHQRTTIAARMGATHVPCVRVTLPFDERRTGINVLFNRATNDMGLKSNGGDDDMVGELAASIVVASAQHLPKIDPSDWPAWCPTLQIEERPTVEVIARAGEWTNDRHSVSGAAQLRRNGIIMPVVISADGQILNGWGRVLCAAEAGDETVPVVECPDERADLARLLLNRLSMDFALEDRYADILRYNSFRRARGRMTTLNRTMLGWYWKNALHAGKKGASLTPHSRTFNTAGRDMELWTRLHGRTVVDFGAGLCDKTDILLKAGVDAIPFEPFYTGGSDSGFDFEGARRMGQTFIDRIGNNDRFDTIFVSAVLNSVPFRRDRELIVTLLAALCWGHPGTQVISGSANQGIFINNVVLQSNASGGANHTRFTANYEPGVVVADLERSPKMQKYHTLPEWRQLWGTQFARVEAWEPNTVFVMARATNPMPPDVAQLSEAVAFEFDLPYPDGTRFGLASQAFDAFEARLGMKLDRSHLDKRD